MRTPFTDPVMARKQAAEARRLAKDEKLPNVRARLIASAEVFERVADQADRTKVAAAKNAAAAIPRALKDRIGS